jgi:hypothetical protein
VFESFKDSLLVLNSYGKSLNSKLIRIPYVDSTFDLHLQYDNEIKDMGMIHDSISVDLDSTIRINNPDIGAYEIVTVPSQDIGVAWMNENYFYNGVCPGFDTLKIALKNYGSTNFNGCQIHIEINDSIYAPIVYSGILNSFESDTVKVEIFITDSLSGEISISVTDASGVSDSYSYNNSKSTSYYTSLHGSFDVGQGLDFENSHDIMEIIRTNGICGNVTVNLYDTLYNYGVIDSIAHMTSQDTLSFIGKLPGLYLGGIPMTELDGNGILENECSITAKGVISFKHLWFDYGLKVTNPSLIIDSCNFNPYSVLGSSYPGVFCQQSLTMTNTNMINSFIEVRPGSNGQLQNKLFLKNNTFLNSSVGTSSVINKIEFINNYIEGGLILTSDTLLFTGNEIQALPPALSSSSQLNQIELEINHSCIIDSNKIETSNLSLTGVVNFSNNLVYGTGNNGVYNFSHNSSSEVGLIYNNSFVEVYEHSDNYYFEYEFL